MSSVLLAPHNDDETLFAAYTLQREQPHVIVCTRADSDYRRREDETREAVYLLTGEATYEQWTFDASVPNWKQMEEAIASLADDYEHIWAPAYNHARNGLSEGALPPAGWGILQHDTIGWFAHRRLPPERITHYCLYTRWHGRDDRGRLIEPSGREIARKLDALSQYESQIEGEATRSWFYDRLDLREWVL